MSEGLADQAPILVNELPRTDRHEVTAERQEPAGEGIEAAYPEPAPIGVALYGLAEPERG